MAEYVIKDGDTLSSIAKQFGLSDYGELVAVNGIKNANKIRAGRKLIIPGKAEPDAIPSPRPRPGAEAPPRETRAAPTQPGRGPDDRGVAPQPAVTGRGPDMRGTVPQPPEATRTAARTDLKPEQMDRMRQMQGIGPYPARPETPGTMPAAPSPYDDPSRQYDQPPPLTRKAERPQPAAPAPVEQPVGNLSEDSFPPSLDTNSMVEQIMNLIPGMNNVQGEELTMGPNQEAVASTLPPPPPGFTEMEALPPPPPGFTEMDAAPPASFPAARPEGPAGGMPMADDGAPDLNPIVQALQFITNPGAAGMGLAQDTLENGVEYPRAGVQGSGRGLANIAGAPFDLTNALLNLGLFGADKAAGLFGGGVDYRLPVGASDTIANTASGIAESVGYDVMDREEMSQDERLAYDVNNYGTQAVTAGGALATPSIGGRVASGLSKAYRDSARPLLGDAAGGAGSGMAEYGFEEYAEPWLEENAPPWVTPVAKILALLGGGVGGATAFTVADSLANAAATGARTAVTGNKAKNLPLNEQTGEYFTRQDADRAALQVQQATSRPDMAADRIRAQADDLRTSGVAGQPDSALPPTDLLSDDVGLIGLGNKARVSGPANLNTKFIEQGQRTNTAARDLVDEAAPRTGVARAFTDEVDAIKQAEIDVAQARLGQVEGRQTRVNERLTADNADIANRRGQKPVASGQLDESVTNALTIAQGRKNEAFDAIDPNREVEVDPAPLFNAAAAVRGAQGPLNSPGNVPDDLLRRIEGLAGQQADEAAGVEAVDPIPLTYGDAQSLRPELSAAETAARKAGNYPLADNIRTLRGALDRITEDLAATGDIDGAAGRAQDALDIYTQEFAPVWNPGPGDAATTFRKKFNQDRFGRSTTPPSQTADHFLQPGKPEKSASLDRVIASAPNPRAGRQAAEDFLLSDLAESGVLDPSGVLRPDVLRRWRDKWGEQLGVAPNLQGRVDDMMRAADRGMRLRGALANQVRTAQQNLSRTQADTGALRFVLNKDPVHAVAGIFNSGDPERVTADILRQLGGNSAARDGLKVAVRDYLLERATNSAVQNTTTRAHPVSFQKLDEVFKKHEDVLAQIYTPEEMNNLRAAHKFLAPSKNRELRAGTGSDTAEKGSQIPGADYLEAALRLKYGMLKGGGIMSIIKKVVAKMPTTDDGVLQIMNQMWFDPELAAHLLTRKVEQVNTPAWNAKLNRLLGYAGGARETGEDDKPLAPDVEK
jgi:LysM repeat protein